MASEGAYRKNMDFSNWDLSNVTNIKEMFKDNHWSSSTDVAYEMGVSNDFTIPKSIPSDWTPVKIGGNLAKVTDFSDSFKYLPMNQSILQTIVGTWKLKGTNETEPFNFNVDYKQQIQGKYTTADGVTITVNNNGAISFSNTE